MRRPAIRILSIVAFVALWWVGAAVANSPLIPGPAVVAGDAWTAAVTGELWQHLWATVVRVYIGFMWSLLAGIVLGVLMGLFKLLNEFFDFWIVIILAIPSLCWSILAMMWFGLNEAAAIFVIGVMSVPVLTINTIEGVKNIDVELIRMARVYKANRWKVVREIILPSIFPYLLAGSRYGLGLSWKIAIIAEMLGMDSGVGYMIRFHYNMFRMDEVLAWTLVFALIVLFVDAVLLRQLEQKVTMWRAPVIE